MLVRIRLFAVLRERVGRESMEVELESGATVQDAIEALSREPGLGELMERLPVVMAVNREYAPQESVLSEGDELALIPPVSGGSEAAGAEDAPAADAGSEVPAFSGSFSSGDGYERFMELIGNHVPRPPGYAKLLGIRPLHAEPGHVRLEFNVGDELLNPAGVIQGGFVTAMLDETMGPAALSELGAGFGVPTLELKVSFLRPAFPGRFVSDARVVHRGRSVVFMEATLFDDKGEKLATATATARIVPLKKKD
jgi:molybdopterin converting factor subunit 1